MKNLFVALLAVFVVACSSSTSADEEEFEPYEIGSFLVTSPETADWEGVNTASKVLNATSEVDSLNMDQPNQGVGIKIFGTPHHDIPYVKERGNPLHVTFVFIDSTIVDNYRNWDIEFSAPFLEDTVDALAKGIHAEGDFVSYQKNTEFYCDSTYNFDSQNIHLRLIDKSSDYERLYIFNVDGAIPTIRDLLLCE